MYPVAARDDTQVLPAAPAHGDTAGTGQWFGQHLEIRERYEVLEEFAAGAPGHPGPVRNGERAGALASVVCDDRCRADEAKHGPSMIVGWPRGECQEKGDREYAAAVVAQVEERHIGYSIVTGSGFSSAHGDFTAAARYILTQKHRSAPRTSTQPAASSATGGGGLQGVA